MFLDLLIYRNAKCEPWDPYLLITSPSLPLVATILLFLLFQFSKLCACDIMQSFCACLISLRVTFPRFIHISANGSISFFNVPSYMCVCLWICIHTYYLFFIHLLVCRHIHCFSILAIMNNASVNTGAQIPLWSANFTSFMNIRELQKVQKLHPGLSCGWQGPNSWAICCCFPKYISRKLDRKWSSSVSNWHQDMGYWHCKQLLKPQHHRLSPY